MEYAVEISKLINLICTFDTGHLAKRLYILIVIHELLMLEFLKDIAVQKHFNLSPLSPPINKGLSCFEPSSCGYPIG